MKNKLIEFLKQLPPMQSDKDFEAQADEILALLDVVGQSEQLKAYAELLQKKYVYNFFDEDIQESVNKFLSL